MRDLTGEHRAIRTVEELAAWAARMYAEGELDDCEMLRGSNLQPWDFPAGWKVEVDNGEDCIVVDPKGGRARWCNSERAWVVES